MKYLVFFLIVIVVLSVKSFSSTARTVNGGGSNTPLPSFDRSMFTMRYNAAGDCRYYLDDYFQYSPAAVMLGLKACCYESRSTWGRMLVSDAFSVAVMAAAMLHEEYGWRSPWFSFGGYAIASATGISRIINNRHWATDVIAGAAIGIASVKLGYFLADLIFKKKNINGQYVKPVIGFDSSRAYYDIGLYLGYRFFIGDAGLPAGKGILRGGGTSGIEISVPVSRRPSPKGTAGVALRVGANSCIAYNSLSFNTYDFMAGGYWRRPFARILEVDARILAGYSLVGNREVSASAGVLSGIALSAGCSLAVATGENFKIKAIAEYGASRFTSPKPILHSIVLGGSALFFW